MNNTLKIIAASAVTSIGLAFAASAERIDNEGPAICEGQMFGGDYLAIPHPSYAGITTDILNLAIGDTIVANIDDQGPFHLVTPINQGTDCNDFMRELMDTGLFESIEPNWILGIGGPGPDFY